MIILTCDGYEYEFPPWVSTTVMHRNHKIDIWIPLNYSHHGPFTKPSCVVLTTFVKQPFQSIIIIYDWQQDEIDYKLNIVFQSYISMKIDIYEPISYPIDFF